MRLFFQAIEWNLLHWKGQEWAFLVKEISFLGRILVSQIFFPAIIFRNEQGIF